MDPQPRADSAYRLSAAHVLRLVAPFELLIGVAWLAAALTEPPRGLVLALGIVTVVVALTGSALFVRPPRVLALTADGYRIGVVRGVGRTAAAWRDVESVATTEVAGAATLVIALSDGGRSALPLSFLGARKLEAQREVHERLNGAFGYRRF
jgi:hypothetical protein